MRHGGDEPRGGRTLRPGRASPRRFPPRLRPRRPDAADPAQPGPRDPPRVDRAGRDPRGRRLRPQSAEPALAAAGPRPPHVGRRSRATRAAASWSALDQFGNVLGHDVIYLVGKPERREEARRIVAEMVEQHQLSVVAIGNGTACRDTRGFHRRAARQRSQGQGRRLRDRQRGGGERLFDQPAGPRGVSAVRRHAPRGGFHRPPPPGPAERAGQDRARPISASASTSTTSRPSTSTSRSTRWSSRASTTSAWTSTRPARRCCATSPA